jgi:6-phosphofructokinase
LKDYEANLPEYDVRVSVLGHMQRGGSPLVLRVLASRLGESRGVIARRKIKLYGWFAK